MASEKVDLEAPTEVLEVIILKDGKEAIHMLMGQGSLSRIYETEWTWYRSFFGNGYSVHVHINKPMAKKQKGKEKKK